MVRCLRMGFHLSGENSDPGQVPRQLLSNRLLEASIAVVFLTHRTCVRFASWYYAPEERPLAVLHPTVSSLDAAVSGAVQVPASEAGINATWCLCCSPTNTPRPCEEGTLLGVPGKTATSGLSSCRPQQCKAQTVSPLLLAASPSWHEPCGFGGVVFFVLEFGFPVSVLHGSYLTPLLA